MATQVFQFDDNKYGHIHKTEDAYGSSDIAVCVADGITRDPMDIKDFTGHSVEELINNNPRPSPALHAAESFCESFLNSAASEDDPKAAFIAANKAIAQLNTEKNIDYLGRDFAACVAAGAILIEKKLHWASVGDCFVALFDSNMRLKFKSPDGTRAWAEYERRNPGNWAKPEYRHQVRSQFRNNPNQIIEGKLVSYGALTGEPNACHFFQSGKQQIQDGDIVLCFSDGFAHVTDHPDFGRKLLAGKEEFSAWQQELANKDYESYGHERTLLVRKIQLQDNSLQIKQVQ